MFSLTITGGALQLVSDDRESGEAATETGMGSDNGERRDGRQPCWFTIKGRLRIGNENPRTKQGGRNLAGSQHEPLPATRANPVFSTFLYTGLAPRWDEHTSECPGMVSVN